MSLSITIRHQLGDQALDVGFEAPKGVTALFGPSGSGKTSVVNAVAGLLTPEVGRIAVEDTVLLDTEVGISLPPHARQIGYVFQEARLFPHLTVAQNLDYGRRMRRLTRDRTQEAYIIELLGIGDLLTRRPGRLSGGEQQRVAIGRALLSRPRLLLMDEPLAALDGARKAEILPYLERLCQEAALPILYVSHALTEVARLATTLVILRQGQVQHAGPAETLLADPEAAAALGVRDAGALITAALVAHADDGLSELRAAGGTLWLPRVSASPGVHLRVRIRAQDVILARQKPDGISALNVLEGQITALHEGQGPGVLVQLRCGQDQILARITQRSARALDLAIGQRIFAIVKSVSVAQADVGSGL